MNTLARRVIGGMTGIARTARVTHGALAPILSAVWREHRALALITGIFVAAMGVVGPVAGWPGLVGGREYMGVLLYLTPFVLLPAAFASLWRYRHQYHMTEPGLAWHAAWAAAARDLRQRHITLERAFSYAFALMLTALVLATYSGWKQTFPEVAPFSWDQAFMRLDAMLHLGRLPHEWLSSVLAYPGLLRAWDRLYIVSWFGVVALAWILVAASPPSPFRRRFFVANALIWITLGVVMATVFSSAGPWAYGAVVGEPDPYAAFMTRLREVDAAAPVKSLAAQSILWGAFTSGTVLVGGGISAMPSLHIAMVTLVALASRCVSRWLAVLAAAYAVAMLVGSVLSGMHYAVDGYVSALGAWVLWRLSATIAS